MSLAYYNEAFKEISAKTLKLREQTQWNYSYYPVIFNDETQLLKVKSALEKQEIYPRRYFYPGLNTLPYVTKVTCKVADAVSSSVLCLPFYPDLQPNDIHRIINIILKNL